MVACRSIDAIFDPANVAMTRIRHAKERLEHSDLNMSETVWAAGFRYLAYFDQVFRAHTWMTPKEYRHQVRQKR